MGKKIRIVSICLAGLFLAANIYVDLFAEKEPRYWKIVLAVGVISMGSAALLNLLLSNKKNENARE